MQHRRYKKSNPYKEANEAFLQVKAQEEAMVFPSGPPWTSR